MKYRVVVLSGYAVLAAIVAILVALAFFRGGHPPASGIIVLLILFVVTPLAVAAAALGLTTQAPAADQKLFFTMAGVCLAFAVFSVVLLFFKFVLGRSI